MKKMIFTVLLLTFLAISADARPQYSMLQTYGTKCNTCHENNQGGGLRSAPGFLSRKDMAVIKPEWIGLQGAFDKLSTSSFLDDKILIGLDTRIQSAKWKVPGKTERDWMFMLGTPYLAIKPFDWLEFEGYYNAAMDISEMPTYAGQQQYGASMILKIDESLPNLRVGLFQPTIGQKWDDHTMLIRQVPLKKNRSPLVPADYAELGVQLDYEVFDLFGFSAGAFTATNLASSGTIAVKSGITVDGKYTHQITNERIVDSSSISYVLRGTVNPELPLGLTGYAGGTMLINDDFYIGSAFLGLGMNDSWSLCAEWMKSYKQHGRMTDAFLVDFTYQVTEAVLPFVRFERAIVREVSDIENNIYTNQYVVGAHINLLPYVDVFPEYRIYDSESVEGWAGQWAFQVHIFY